MNLLFPRACPLCRGPLEETIEDACEDTGGDQCTGLCPGCLSGFREVKGLLCTVCGIPFSSAAAASSSASSSGRSATGHHCGECAKGGATIPFSRARSAVYYDGEAADAIMRFKYSWKTELAPVLGRLASLAAVATTDAGSTVAKDNRAVKDKWVVVPVPLHGKRLAERGFNQSLVLARSIARSLSLGLDYRALKRIRHTQPQVELKGTARAINVKGAFAVDDESLLRGRGVLLVDDVYTTGATVKECARVIKKAGAGEVVVATIARAASA